ncbi:high-affinity branched-chain amino acid ABC transporter permease LivM [Hyphomicrobium sp.]|uniref:high-affinity branched-chain amino acid ABC transporter permease LivM n=1 Tax=Hyphomicrobium sp. TaxID=82 RepID=UPI0025BFBF5C|nr:high-affinity branched-chain amino acid ABC transporter permease LivM [Hyphomicrobium sp.]MCC7252019.1 high-affinity branched-chain amino acid ABC transporter permease LivM [Hyphomicrobium sp.]
MGAPADALKRALIVGLVTLGLAFPIVALRTDANFSNQLVLTQRWGLAFTLAGIAFVAAFLLALVRPVGFERTTPGKTVTSTPPHPFLRYLPYIGLAFLLAYPFIALGISSAGGTGVLKLVDTYGIQILIYVLLGLGLNIILGLAGLLDLGFVAFYAVGAYSSALLTTTFGLSFWLVLPLAGILAAFWGVMISLPVLRLKGDYIAIVTLAFAEIVRLVLVNWVPVTGGYAGISSIPKPTLFGFSLGSEPGSLPYMLGFPPSPIYRLAFMYYLVLALALAAYWVTIRLRTLPVGRAWEAMREDEIACRSLGINTVTTKVTAFAAGAFFGGLAGAFFSAHYGFISPKSFEFLESAMIVAIVVLGGLGSMVGVAIAATVMIGGTELLRELGLLKAVFGPDFDPAQYRMMLFGLAMVMLMVWRPKGLIATREPTVRLKPPATRGAPAAVPAE